MNHIHDYGGAPTQVLLSLYFFQVGVATFIGFFLPREGTTQADSASSANIDRETTSTEDLPPSTSMQSVFSIWDAAGTKWVDRSKWIVAWKVNLYKVLTMTVVAKRK